jgi:hypothetical protein
VENTDEPQNEPLLEAQRDESILQMGFLDVAIIQSRFCNLKMYESHS